MVFTQQNNKINNSSLKSNQESGEDIRKCEFPECNLEGHFKAPHSPDALRKWRWFCLNHVRDYNKAWNYFSGWSEKDIEAWQREDLTGHRPTWPLGKGAKGSSETDNLKSQFQRFAKDWFDKFDPTNEKKKSEEYFVPSQSPEALKAIELFNLSPPLTSDEIKKQYKFLVKKHHPDANGGSKESEEMLKSINQAYAYLINKLI